MNTMRTGLLLAVMTGLFLVVGYLLGREQGMVIALMIAIATNLFAYWNADRMVLSMYGAKEVSRAQASGYYSIVERLTARAGLPMPRVFIIDSPQPNAFATGRNPQHAAVAATTGLLAMMTRDEVEGVMAHELTHVKNRDTLVMTVTAALAGAISMLANWGMFFGGGRDRNNPLGPLGAILMMILAPLAAMLVQMAVSRTREYGADRGGAEISGKPLALASALAKLDRAAHRIPNPEAEANPATAHLFIVNPLSGAGMDNLFSTHPDTGNRIAALREIARQMGQGSGATMNAPPPQSQPTPETGRPRGPWG